VQTAAAPERDLVLVGGGHAHVQVIKRWMMEPVPGVALTVVLDRTEAIYSGMVPGFVAGEVAAVDCTIDLLPLVARAGGTVVHAAATRIDPEASLIELEGRPPLRYDVASLDVGSTVRGLDQPGVARFALATRPIGRFVERLGEEVETLRARLAARPAGAPPRVVIVGAGAAGVEIACCLHARLGDLARRFDWSLLSPDETPLASSKRSLRKAVQRALDARGIRFVPRSQVVEVRRDSVSTQRPGAAAGERLDHPADLVVWAAGGAALPVCADSPLPHDDAGFVRVGPSLLVEGTRTLFAVGDCAAFAAAPLPKAGVYAVRQGPVLSENLRAALEGRPLRRYRPQRDFLHLLNVGGGRAIGHRNGLSFEGPAMWRLKDRIDRGFMAKFQVLDARGRPAPGFAAPNAMAAEGEAMECGGCAAKVGSLSLEHALAGLSDAHADPSVLLGLDRPDDAAALELPGGDVLIATVDGFRAFDGDAHLVARVAAQNALSDVYAKGGTPHHALALVTVERGPADRTRLRLAQVLAGLRRELDAAGVSLVGGHSTIGPELFVGLTVTGTMTGERAPLSIDRLRPGDRLVLTKALGTGVVLAASMRGLAPSRAWGAAIASMLRPNADAARLALEHDVAAATDVSGFGLLGHLGEMLRASGVDAVLDPARVPALPLALDLLERGVHSTAHEANTEARRFLASGEWPRGPAFDLLLDPQTSGGLLVGVSAHDAERYLDALRRAGDAEACIVGCVEAGSGLARLAKL